MKRPVKLRPFILLLAHIFIFMIIILTVSQLIHPTMKYIDIECFYPSPDGKYMAVISENKYNYYVHIRPEITEDVISDLINKNQKEKGSYISKYSYGKNGDIIVEWEEEDEILWIWSSDIGLNIIQRKDELWEENFYSDIKNTVIKSHIPDRIRHRAKL